jgi:hypothetical protein
MSQEELTPLALREQANRIRQSAEYAQGQTRRDELETARELEQRAEALERTNPDAEG